MEESFTGVCDIEISGSKVKKIQIKPDDISGVMLSYGNGTMQIAGQGDIPMQSDKLPVYDETGAAPKESGCSVPYWDWLISSCGCYTRSPTAKALASI